jgi:IrrE N-terminal-like domain
MSQTAPAPTQMSDLYTSLATIGLPKQYIKNHILPDWWTDDVDQTPGTLMQGALYIAHRLNLNIPSLFDGNTPQFTPTPNPKFKTQTGVDLATLTAAQAIASRIAELVAYACPQPYQDITHRSIATIRKQILSNHPSLSLDGILEFCWAQGIPVIHFTQFPHTLQRFHGMVAYFHDRPVILVSRNERSPAWILFIIAHELGHILQGHLSTNGLLVDQDIQLESDDAEENEANQAAAELLLGQSGISYDLWTKFLTGENLAVQAQQFAQKSQNDPGVITLNIAWNRAQRAQTKQEKSIAWATGNKALKILGQDSNASHQINHYLDQTIQWDALRDESQDYLKGMLNL